LVGKKDSLTIQQFKEGKFITSYETFKLILHGIPFEIASVEIDNEKIDISKLTSEITTLIITKEFTELHIIGK